MIGCVRASELHGRRTGSFASNASFSPGLMATHLLLHDLINVPAAAVYYPQGRLGPLIERLGVAGIIEDNGPRDMRLSVHQPYWHALEAQA